MPLLHTRDIDPAALHDLVHDLVLEHGAVRLRGLDAGTAGQAATAAALVAPRLIEEREGFAPRDRLGGSLYSSAKWPPDQPMCMHHELSYTTAPPRLMIQICLRAPSSGGATALADSRAVLAALPAGLVDRFARTGWCLTRHYNELVGLTWQEAFGTEDRALVESYCRAHRIETRWEDDGGLRTRQSRPAIVRHPLTGDPCWFNQVAFLNGWTMDPEVRDYLLMVFGPGGLPFDTCFGDGEPIGADVVGLINETYDRHTVREPWQDGDVLVIDNILTAHSREPYEGPREVVVALADPIDQSGAPTVLPGSASTASRTAR
ncbi:TauD/TfdA family dioxygenase [Nonomuraea sp. NPDC050643]|uniref:TauD/TfdA family dioxygenase n=1 Tax=Nonomuraea sp. NPDC050643 TaxID=3155660 RepID=UPI0033D37260